MLFREQIKEHKLTDVFDEIFLFDFGQSAVQLIQ
jgi:hypothetical protein